MKNFKILIILIGTMFSSFVYGNVKIDSIEASVYLKKGSTFFRNGKYDSAIYCFQYSNKYFIESGNQLQVIKNVNDIVNAHLHLGNFESSIEEGERALRLNKQYFAQKNNDELSRTYTLLGLINRQKGDYHQATVYFEKANEIAESLYSSSHPYLIQSLRDLGIINGIKGNYVAALNYLQRTLDLSIEFNGEISMPTAVTYSMMGLLYEKFNDPQSSFEYNQKSVVIAEKIFNHQHPVAAMFLSNLGASYLRLEENVKAESFFLKALEIAQKFTPKESINSDIYVNLATISQMRGEYDQSEYYYQKAVDVILDNYGSSFISLPIKYRKWGEMLRESGDLEGSLSKLNKSIEANISYFSLNPENSFISGEAYKDGLHLVASMFELSLTFKQFPNFKNNEELLLKSFNNLMSADTVISHQLHQYYSQEDQLSFTEKTNDIYKLGISVCHDLYEHTGNPYYIERAFAFSEKSKSAVLQLALAKAKFEVFEDIPDSLLKEENKLKVQLSLSKSALSNLKGSTDEESEKKKSHYYKINEAYQTLLKKIKEEYPNYHELKYNTEFTSIGTIQSSLSDDENFIEYSIIDSAMYVFTINSDGIKFNKNSFDAELSQDVLEFKNSLSKDDMNGYQNLGVKLYDQLIKPIKNYLRGNHITIVPDEYLWHVNFELLLKEKTDPLLPKDYSYLLKDFSISYANSATMLFNRNRSGFIEHENECLAFAYGESVADVSGERSSLRKLRSSQEDLPGSRKEIRYVAEILEGDYFFGAESNEKNFKALAGDYSILHLALHGEIDDQEPQNSKLFFTPSKDSIEDNFLYSHELYALDLPAELAVLSACNTGTGQIAKGEGIMSLGRAFQYAGTQSIIIGGWEVSDETTPLLIKYFYSALKDGKTKSEALRYAKLNFLKNDADNISGSPFYWGAFTVIGNNDGLNQTNRSNIVIFSILGLLLVIGLIWGIKRKY